MQHEVAVRTDLQTVGGIAGLVEAALYVTGFALFFTVLDGSGHPELDQKIRFLANNEFALFVAHLLIYVLFGIVLVVLALALHERLKGASPDIMRIATAFALIWAGLVIASGMIANIGTASVVDLYEQHPQQAFSLWLAISTIQEALGGGNEVVGGLWLVLLSSAALSSGLLPKALNYLGVLVGSAGVLTVVPTLPMLMDVFGLGQIVWFTWVGVVLLRSRKEASHR